MRSNPFVATDVSEGESPILTLGTLELSYMTMNMNSKNFYLGIQANTLNSYIWQKVNFISSYSVSTLASALDILLSVFSVSSKRFLMSLTFCINKCGGAASELMLALTFPRRGERCETSTESVVFTSFPLLLTVLFRVIEKSSSGLYIFRSICCLLHVFWIPTN